ncbi:MAG: DNA-directed RNA polymerase subunit beta [Candidatus Shikimatogenerans sp. Tcar]|uniref:DNA-directed RNA polymerase subunit beta n=1 Tax=Candidatus Shikimatogenerans sp. Tcar TaxID=3158565 RepID=A0AAU7QSC7_9FLAO
MKKLINLNNKSNFKSPDLLFIQTDQFKKFLTLSYKNKKKVKLYTLLKKYFPIMDKNNNICIKYIDYFINKPKNSINTCIKNNLTYEIDIKILLNLYSKKYNLNQNKVIYLTKCPYMTKYGSFIFNGTERVVISQLYKSKSIYFYKSKINNKKLYTVKIIPKYGIWIDMYIDTNKIFYFIINKNKKILLTNFLRFIGYKTNKKILKLFNIIYKIKINNIIKNKIFYIYKNNKIITLFNYKFSKKKKYVYIINEEEYKKNIVIVNTIFKDKNYNYKKTRSYLYNYLYNYLSLLKDKDKIFEELIFNIKKYKITKTLRYNINKLFNISNNNYNKFISKKEFLYIIKYLIYIDYNKIVCNKLDDLFNKKVKTIYNQLLNLFKLGFTRLKKNILSKLNKVSLKKNLDLRKLFNVKIINSILNTFFGTNQLSQFMDQTNILSEMTHKRRLSLLGGNISKNQAGNKIRDINNSFYGKICPIETPEGSNIGLISSICIYTCLDKFNYLISPYLELKNHNKIIYLSNILEKDKIFSTYNIKREKNKYYLSRLNNKFIYSKYKKIDYIDVDYSQIISLSVSQIPFLEHDDANRILMGSNMLRQTIPLLYTKIPIVNTILNKEILLYSKNLLYAKEKGIITYVDNSLIILKYKKNNVYKKKKYYLTKFKKTNQNTCINLTPIIHSNQKVNKNQILCQGYGTCKKFLSLGRDVLVAFLPFKGYNFEDAIVISDNIIKKDIFTSLHIEILNIEIKKNKYGKDKISKNVYKLSKKNKKKLDKKGIIKVGTMIKPGDVLVGILTPKYNKNLSPEMKLLNFIFNKKSNNMKENSYKTPNHIYGKILKIKIIKNKNINNINNNINNNTNNNKIKKLKINFLKKNYKYIKKYKIDNIPLYDFKFLNINLNNKKEYFNIMYKNFNKINFIKIFNKEKKYIYKKYIKCLYYINDLIYEKNKILLNSNIIKTIRIYVIKKRILKVGDKMSGRHGNKGVISKIENEVNMPFLKNGKSIDMIINPLGVPSRMNVGQILETILGMIGKKSNKIFLINPFNSISLNKLNKLIKKNNLPEYCKFDLYDGNTGEKMDQKVTVGYIHILKLNHMVEDKIHVRSIGPYSLITQQPLGGRSQKGGQRFGEMEVWALEAYGAAYCLRELLTLKSDDIEGRFNTYKSIIKNKNLPNPNVPESFNVLIKELNGLNLDILLK